MIIWITGVAGAGKSTVMREILKKNNFIMIKIYNVFIEVKQHCKK